MIARFIPSLAAVGVFAIFAALRFGGAQAIYDQLLVTWGIVPSPFTFLDLGGPLAALDCRRLGMDVIFADPCDVLWRPYNYSPLWLRLDWLPIGDGDRPLIGLVLDLVFLGSLAALPTPRSMKETLLRVAAALSTMVVFAVERANPDVLVFILVVIMLALLGRSTLFRLLGYGVGLLAGLTKYYPIVVLCLVLKERPRAMIPIVIALLGALSLFFYIYAAEIQRTLKLVPHNTPFSDMFGAINFFSGIFEIALRYTLSKALAVEVAFAISAALLAALLVAAIQFWRASDLCAALARLDDPTRLALLAGAFILAGCFFTGQNVGYRGIFLLLVQPGLAALGRDAAAGACAAMARLTTIALPMLMWAEATRVWLHLAVTGRYPPMTVTSLRYRDDPPDMLIWLVRETTWWLLIAFLTMLLLAFLRARASTLMRDLRHVVQPKPHGPS